VLLFTAFRCCFGSLDFSAAAVGKQPPYSSRTTLLAVPAHAGPFFLSLGPGFSLDTRLNSLTHCSCRVLLHLLNLLIAAHAQASSPPHGTTIGTVSGTTCGRQYLLLHSNFCSLRSTDPGAVFFYHVSLLLQQRRFWGATGGVDAECGHDRLSIVVDPGETLWFQPVSRFEGHKQRWQQQQSSSLLNQQHTTTTASESSQFAHTAAATMLAQCTDVDAVTVQPL